jgi:AcrR family transcriptional regulator
MCGKLARMAKPKPRPRRTPEAARTAILDAADRVFARFLPDAVGLREIAAEAKVTHGLVTHYFSTYANLVDQVLARRLAAARETALMRLTATAFAPNEQPLLAAMLDALDDKTLIRLIVWRSLGHDGPLVLGRNGELRRLLDAMITRFESAGGKANRTRFEFAFTAAISMVVGWGVIGEAVSDAVDAEIPRPVLREELQRMLFAYALVP